jgi:glycosyltransferase involved in cell wall biosynthesis
MIRLLMFGYMGPNRRLCDFLKIWARSPWKHRFTLDLVGEIHNRAEVQAVIAETGLGSRINDHGYLPDDALDGLIGRANLVLNLRNPTMGEASGSQLRIWANGAASVVSQTGWYARLPEGSVLRVTIAREQEDLLNLLDDLAHERVDLVSVANRGRACLVDCDPVAYAAALTQWLEQERDAIFARWAETALIERVARSYARCMPPHFMPRFPGRLLA